MHAEDDIPNVSPIRHKISSYPSKESNCGGDYIIVLIDDEHLGKNHKIERRF